MVDSTIDIFSKGPFCDRNGQFLSRKLWCWHPNLGISSDNNFNFSWDSLLFVLRFALIHPYYLPWKIVCVLGTTHQSALSGSSPVITHLLLYHKTALNQVNICVFRACDFNISLKIYQNSCLLVLTRLSIKNIKLLMFKILNHQQDSRQGPTHRYLLELAKTHS